MIPSHPLQWFGGFPTGLQGVCVLGQLGVIISFSIAIRRSSAQFAHPFPSGTPFLGSFGSHAPPLLGHMMTRVPI
ncbi:MAG: hypothetical protein WC461_00235 [Candidatus Paceibacterota bacterium]